MTTLSICIPTYRRPQLLRQCVESAIASAGSRPIQICIADDSVSDVNQAVLTELAEKHACVRWERNPANLGIDANVQKVVQMSECDYVWLVGEDDLFLPDAVSKMVDLLKVCSSPFIFANYKYADETHRKDLGPALTHMRLGEHATQFFVAQSLWAVGFLGSCVVKKSAWDAAESSAYIGSYFRHVGHVLEILSREPNTFVVPAASIANRAAGRDTFTWKDDSFGVFFGFEAMCRSAATRHPHMSHALALAAENYRRHFAYLSIKTTFRLRSEGAFDRRQYDAHIARSGLSASLKAWLFFLALLPIFLLRPMALIYTKAVGMRARG